MSEENKARKKAVRGEKRRQEEQKERRAMALYGAVAVLVAAAAVVLMVWNSGLLQRSLTALDVNGTKYTAADVQYCYNSIYSSYANQYAFDSGVSVKKQVFDQETGQTWHDYLMEQTVEALTDRTALAAKASDEGFTLTEESQSQLDSFISQLDTAWISYGYANRNAFIRASYGPYMTYDRLIELTRLEYLVSDYANARLDAIDHPDSDYDAYYKEHADELDTVTYSVFTFRAAVSATDADGNSIEMTDAERAAALEELKPEQKALAEEFKSKAEAGGDLEALDEEYGDKLYSSSLSSASTGSSLTLYTPYGDWLVESGRRAGDATLSEQGSGSAYFYYVVVFEGRALVTEPTSDVRHLLIRAGTGDGAPTQEEFDEAEQKAQALLDEWEAGEKTEESFTAMVAANTEDASSTNTGGLISNVTSASSYAFRDWAADPARKAGEVDLVKSEDGWHIVYYVSSNDPIWKQTTASALRDQDLEQLSDSACEGWSITEGFGMKLVSA